MEDAIKTFGEKLFDLSFTGYLVLGLLLVGLAGYFRRVSVSGKKSYDKMWAPVAPTLEAKPSPMDQVFKGWLGCLQAILAFVLFGICIVLAFDALFNEFNFLFSLLN